MMMTVAAGHWGRGVGFGQTVKMETTVLTIIPLYLVGKSVGQPVLILKQPLPHGKFCDMLLLQIPWVKVIVKFIIQIAVTTKEAPLIFRHIFVKFLAFTTFTAEQQAALLLPCCWQLPKLGLVGCIHFH